MAILVIAEHGDAALKVATLATVTAAAAIGGEITILVAGHGCRTAAEAATAIPGIANVLIADHPRYARRLAEPTAALVVGLAGKFSHILAPATAAGRNLLPRVAALLDVHQISEIVAVEAPDTFVRPIYAGNALATVRSSDRIKVITVRATAFAPAAAQGGRATFEVLSPAGDPGLSRFVGRELSKSQRPDLAIARVVVAGGRGLGSAEKFRLVEYLADKLGAAVGASRAAVDAGYVGNDLQVGQTGKIVAPDLYIAVGISGAAQHLAGMTGSKVIVAINRDEEAPMFQVADYGLVADLFKAVPELIDAL